VISRTRAGSHRAGFWPYTRERLGVSFQPARGTLSTARTSAPLLTVPPSAAVRTQKPGAAGGRSIPAERYGQSGSHGGRRGGHRRSGQTDLLAGRRARQLAEGDRLAETGRPRADRRIPATAAATRVCSRSTAGPPPQRRAGTIPGTSTARTRARSSEGQPFRPAFIDRHLAHRLRAHGRTPCLLTERPIGMSVRHKKESPDAPADTCPSRQNEPEPKMSACADG